MDESDFTDPFVPTYVNQEPEVIKGLTSFELMFSIGTGAIVGIASAVVIGLTVGLIAGLISMLGIGIAAGFLLMKKIRSTKAGKPKGYMSFALRKWAIKHIGDIANQEGFYLFDERLTVGRSHIPRFEIVERKGSVDE